jgi:hypothetical protein
MAISDNWQKAAPSIKFGTPELDFYVVDLGTDVETDYELSNSLFSQAVRGIQLVANLYMVGTPSGNSFTIAVARGTCPGSNPGAITGTNSFLQDAVDAATGESSSVYYAAFDGASFIYND